MPVAGDNKPIAIIPNLNGTSAQRMAALLLRLKKNNKPRK